MRKLFFAIFAFAAIALQAQNLQLHYDFGRNIYSDEEPGRQKVTATFETFKADNLGSWFYFIDLDLNSKGVIGAYGELSREFNVGNNGWAFHMEYDGGLSKDGGVFQSAALFGPAWNGHNADFSTTYSIQALYKPIFNNYFGHGYTSFQLTGVWSTTFASGKATFSGFIDFWRGENDGHFDATKAGHGQLVWLTEPQLWYNFNNHVSLGTEIELSNNFQYVFSDKSFYINPTIGMKFNF